MTGMPRALLPWRTTIGSRWIAIGTESNLYAQNSAGQNFDITPAGFVTGNADQLANTGFGSGPFGAGTFGTPRQDTGNPIPATVWDLDNFGNYLVGNSPADGAIYQWTLDPATPAAALSGAPTGCLGVVVTQDAFVMALGAGGDPRKVQWSDQGAATVWTPTTTNQSGDVDLVTAGNIKRGLRLENVVLILTDIDAHAGEYVGLPQVYRFDPVGYGCGAISKGCLVAKGSQAAWWSESGFWFFDGQSANPLSCDVWDFVRSDLNQAQRTKISGFHNSANGEIWWFYPSTGSSENDSYVFWDYRKSLELGAPVWGVGQLARLAAYEKSVFSNPLAMGPDGLCYEHEVGFAYDGAEPYARTTIQLGDGDYCLRVLGMIPDEAISGQVTATFRARQFANAAKATIGTITFDGSGRTDVRFEARQVELEITGAAGADWRWGEGRLQGSQGSRR